MLDPCEDENNEMEEDGISIGADSGQNDESSESDSEVNLGHVFDPSNTESVLQ